MHLRHHHHALGWAGEQVKLFRWPAPVKDSEAHCYNGELSETATLVYSNALIGSATSRLLRDLW
jgi:hypothetical protein